MAMALREEGWMERTGGGKEGKQAGDDSDWRAGISSLEGIYTTALEPLVIHLFYQKVSLLSLVGKNLCNLHQGDRKKPCAALSCPEEALELYRICSLLVLKKKIKHIETPLFPFKIKKMSEPPFP